MCCVQRTKLLCVVAKEIVPNATRSFQSMIRRTATLDVFIVLQRGNFIDGGKREAEVVGVCQRWVD